MDRVTGLTVRTADDDDEPPASSGDSACHKDTDCKGDRICQAGNCVDAKAAGEPAKPPEGPFKLAACDAFANLYDSRISKCAPVQRLLSTASYKDMLKVFPDVPKDRYDAVGARCSDATSKIASLLGKMHC